VVQRRRDGIEALRSIAQFGTLPDWLGSDRAAEVLRVLIGTEPAAFLDNDAVVAGQVLGWFDHRRRLSRFRSRDLAAPLVSILDLRHDDVWRVQARRLLASTDDIADEHPRVCRLAATLAAGHLASPEAVAALDDSPAQPRAQIQHVLLGDFYGRRAVAVDQQWSALGRRERRHLTRAQIEADYDKRSLHICDTCTLVFPAPVDGSSVHSQCRHCNGTIIDWPDRTTITTLTDRLKTIGAAPQ
jgi:hypothetical protein